MPCMRFRSFSVVPSRRTEPSVPHFRHVNSNSRGSSGSSRRTAASLCRCVREYLPEERRFVLPVVELPDPLVQVRVEPAARNRVVGAAYVVLEVPEEPFDRVRMHVTADVDVLLVVDAAVAVTLAAK